MPPKKYVDIRGLSFDGFVAFLFAHDLPNESFASLYKKGETQKRNPWYWHTVATFDSLSACSSYIQLFRAPKFLLDTYSRDQLEQGFWAVQCSTLNCSAYSVVWDRDLPFAPRRECIRSMFVLFRDLFATEPFGNSVCMWWDSFCYAWHCGNRKRSRGGEDRTMQDVMFETLVDILELESRICQGAALHGLSHLHHPDTGNAIRLYLSRNPSLGDDWKSIALAAAEFTLM